jgi:hypothetical protein
MKITYHAGLHFRVSKMEEIGFSKIENHFGHD